MDSFAQQMLNEIDKAFQSATRISTISDEDGYDDASEKEKTREMRATEIYNSSQKINITNGGSVDLVEGTIYANINVHERNDTNALSNTITCVPTGRKPALPPKPHKQIVTKPKNIVQTAKAAFFDRNAPNKKDPAEMSLKERLALFEKNKDTAPTKTSNQISKENQCHENSMNTNNQNKKDASNGMDLEKPISSIDGQTKDNEDGLRCVEPTYVCKIPSVPPPPPPTRQRNAQLNKVLEYKLSEAQHNNRLQKGIIDNRSGSTLYGDITPIVTTAAPKKLNPNETIGLNDLHENEPNCSLLSEQNQYQPKEEDRWEKFIECLLFFCCVA